MTIYSHFFSTLHDETGPVGDLGHKTHYSVLRCVQWLASGPCFHDVAVIWDEDHDLRVIWVLEQLVANRLLEGVLAIGERKGGITVLTEGLPSAAYVRAVSNIAESVPSDCFSCAVEPFALATGMIIHADVGRVRAYLNGIHALWGLGVKPCTFTVEPFGDSVDEDVHRGR